MGSSKKKDKKKRRRERSSSEEDDYDDGYAGKYSSKRKSETYIVEDVRTKTLQAIADNYSYDDSNDKKKKSKYDDIPETEEYVYDQFGEIVQTTRDMSMSPGSSGDEYDYKAKTSKYKEIYEKGRRKGPVTPSPPPSPKPVKQKKALKSQVKSALVSSTVSTNYQQKKDTIVIDDDRTEYTRKKEPRDEYDQITTGYVQNKSTKDGNNYVYDQKKNKKSSYDLDRSENTTKKSQVKSAVSTDYASADYYKNIRPPSPPDSPPPSPPPKVEKYKSTYEEDILESSYNKSKKEIAPAKSILKSSKSKSDYTTSDYSYQKDTYDNTSDNITSDNITKKESKNRTDYSNYPQSKPSEVETNYVSQDYSQNKNYSNYDESIKKTVDYNSAEYILKKIREQTKFKPTDELTNETKSDYNYTPKNEPTPQPAYRSQYPSTESNYASASYSESGVQRKQTEYTEPEPARKRTQSSDVSTNYVQKNDTRELPGYVSNNAEISNYSYSNNASSSSAYETDMNSSNYKSQKETYRESDYKTYSTEQPVSDPYAYFGSDYGYNQDGSTQDEYPSNNVPKDNVNIGSTDYNYKNDSGKHDDRDYTQDYRERDKYDSGTHENREERLPPAAPMPSAKHSETAPLLPPGTDWPYEESASSTYDYYKDDYRQDNYSDKQSDEKVEKSRNYVSKKTEPVKDEPPPASASSSETLSIEETNKLRAKLGLKPLNVDSGPSTQEKSYSERDDVHKPAINLAEKKSEEKMRERMEAIREKRKINKKLQRVKGLGEEDDPVLDSAAAWVAKSRIQEKEKAMAEKRAQMLEEMDEEFGVTKIMSKGILKKRSKYDDEYDRRNLQGLKVEHRASDLAAAESTILTLKDKDVLDEDEDVLYNVNVHESERARINLKNKKKGPGYQAYDEFDEDTGEFKMRTVLDKYDEEIHGQKKDSFRINTDGIADTEGENHIDKIRAILKSQQVSLATSELQPARDYYTSEEMVSFKKPGRKKVRKVRKRGVLKADDLLKMDIVDTSRDRGSRKIKSAMKNSNKVIEEEDTSMDMDIVPTEIDELDFFVAANQHIDENEPLIDDEAEQELQIALQRSRRAKLKKNLDVGDENDVVEKVAKGVLSKPQVKEEETVSAKMKKKMKGTIVLDSTSEFCRTLGDISTLPSVSHNEPEDKMEDDMDIEEPTTSTAATTTASGWEQVEITEGPKEEDDNVDDDDVLEAEPIPTGLAATLNLANMKGYLKDGKEKVRKFDPLNLPETKAEVDIEKLRDEEKNKYTRGYERERDRERYDPYAWKEKANYKPDIKLEYVDNKGRQMNQKEAFRLLSHKFHGKGSGKLKTEKRSKKLLDEKKLQMMSSIDTPLNTAALFKDKQKQSQSAYLVLSGGGKNILSGETLVKK